MKKYEITGMSCAACSTRVEKAVSKVPGVTECSVNLLTNSMAVEGDASEEAITSAVERAGYGIKAKEHMGEDSLRAKGGAANGEEALQDRETPLLKKRLYFSLLFLGILMYLSMGHMMWGWPVPQMLARNPMLQGILQLLLTTIIMVINQKFFVSGAKSLWHRAPNMDTLVALGAGAAYVYSVYALAGMSEALVQGKPELVHTFMHEFYFESAGMILTLITLGKMLEARSKGKTTDALKSLMRLAPKTAQVIKDGVEHKVPVEAVQKGDIFVVRPGETIPVDGQVLEGSSAVNEAALTGESIPVDKAKDDPVSAATINQSGFLTCQATRVGEDTTLSQIIQMVSDAAATKAPIAKIADKVSGIFVPGVIIIALVTMAAWLLAGESVGFALARAISVLVISCPCALGLATPVAIMVGNGVGAKHGIMFKNAVSLEQTGKTDIVVLDKTGTITKGQPSVTDMVAAQGIEETTLLTMAAALEIKSEHPLAKAIVAKAKEALPLNGQTLESFTKDVGLTDFMAVPGKGLQAFSSGGQLLGGDVKFISHRHTIPENLLERAGELSMEGKTPMLFALGEQVLGLIAVADTIKEDSPQAIKELKNMGIRVVMLTGDNKNTAEAIGRQAGVDSVIAGVLPEGKEQVIKDLKNQGRVAMVGDGINDAPALTRADIGIAIGAGTDVAIDAADVVLMKSSLLDVPAAIRLSRQTFGNICENLFWAFIYNIIGIPLAAGVFIPIWGWELNPMFGAAAMSLSSFCVVSNALRLNFCRLYDSSRDYKRKHYVKKTEEITMTKTMKIQGMMCGHCEARVKKALEALPEVKEAVVSHTTGTAVVTLETAVSDQVLRKTIEDQAYQVLGIE